MIHIDVDEQERENRKNLYISVGAEIKERRKELGITQEDMAERIGKSPIHLRYLETGSRQSMLHVYVDIARELQCTVNDLLHGCYSKRSLTASSIQRMLSAATEHELQLIHDLIRLILDAMKDPAK